MTIEAFKEMAEFEEMLFQCTVQDNTTKITYESICVKDGASCFLTESPLTFVRDESMSEPGDASAEATVSSLDDAELVKLINSGKQY